ncbi:MAG: YqeG family HAD IIIA-type phosphatase [Clostridia bacterium]|nr:YqeG family HAD IIIA-type phosphatase [Clostridia bacterium]
MAFFQPDATFRAYYDLTPAYLTARGITVLLLDIDNTLAPYEQPLPDERLRTWLAGFSEAGIAVGFLSNNHGERVTLFNSELGLSYLCNAHKPLPRKAKKLIKTLGGKPKTAALMGDQIFTDVCCAKLCGAHAILVPPIWDRRDGLTRFKRKLERGPLRRYAKKHPDAPDVRAGNPITEEIREKMK